MKLSSEPLHISVRKAMLDKDIKQTDLAKKFNCGKSYVSMALRGERQKLLIKIASYVFAYKAKRAA